MATLAKQQRQDNDEDDGAEEAARRERLEHKPLLAQCYNLFDFEAVARRLMKKTAWGYYSSAADDEIVSPLMNLSLLPLPLSHPMSSHLMQIPVLMSYSHLVLVFLFIYLFIYFCCL